MEKTFGRGFIIITGQ